MIRHQNAGPLSFTCHECGQGRHENCAGGRNKGGLCDCCPNRQ